MNFLRSVLLVIFGLLLLPQLARGDYRTEGGNFEHAGATVHLRVIVIETGDVIAGPVVGAGVLAYPPHVSSTFFRIALQRKWSEGDTWSNFGIYNSEAYVPLPVITSPLTATATLGQSFNYTIEASGSPTSFDAAGYEFAGLSFSGNVISGTPTETGVFNIMIQASNGAGTDTKTLVLTVNDDCEGHKISELTFQSSLLPGQEREYLIATKAGGVVTLRKAQSSVHSGTQSETKTIVLPAVTLPYPFESGVQARNRLAGGSWGDWQNWGYDRMSTPCDQSAPDPDCASQPVPDWEFDYTVSISLQNSGDESKLFRVEWQKAVFVRFTKVSGDCVPEVSWIPASSEEFTLVAKTSQIVTRTFPFRFRAVVKSQSTPGGEWEAVGEGPIESHEGDAGDGPGTDGPIQSDYEEPTLPGPQPRPETVDNLQDLNDAQEARHKEQMDRFDKQDKMSKDQIKQDATNSGKTDSELKKIQKGQEDVVNAIKGLAGRLDTKGDGPDGLANVTPDQAGQNEGVMALGQKLETTVSLLGGMASGWNFQGSGSPQFYITFPGLPIVGDYTIYSNSTLDSFAAWFRGILSVLITWRFVHAVIFQVRSAFAG